MGCYNSVVVTAPVEKVWSLLRNFHDFSWCPNVIQQVEPVGDARTCEIGARRILNGVFHETLVALDDMERTLRYSIDDGPDAVSRDNVQGYVGEIRVFPVTDEDHTFVLWTSRWESSKGGVKGFCDPIYHALLGALKQDFE